MRSWPGWSLLLAVAVATACGGAVDQPLSGAPETGQVSVPAVLADLCAAQDVSGDPSAARTAFARAHGPLHELARDVESRERQAAARLLEHKQRVESALERGAEPGIFAASLADLLESTRRALQAVGSPAPPCR